MPVPVLDRSVVPGVPMKMPAYGFIDSSSAFSFPAYWGCGSPASTAKAGAKMLFRIVHSPPSREASSGSYMQIRFNSGSGGYAF